MNASPAPSVDLPPLLLLLLDLFRVTEVPVPPDLLLGLLLFVEPAFAVAFLAILVSA